jgi:anti-sigma factor RsiW
MNCSTCRPLLGAYLDGEIDAAGCVEIEAHLAGCAGCSAQLEAARELSLVLRARASRPVPRPEFERALEDSFGARRRGPARRTLALASACAASLLLGWLLAFASFGPRAQTSLAGEVVAAHVRSLQADHLVDVASSDRHTVTPWFQGKLPFAVASRDLAEHGFALAGGRLDLVGGRPAAALAYRRGPHAVNVFVWSSDAPDAPLEVAHLRGYSMPHWTRAGLEHWIVSDADESGLVELAHLLE